MPTVGMMALTLNDWRKRMNPQGYIDDILEVLNQSNPILDDMKFMEGNLLTGNQSTLRNSLTEPNVRRINRGVPYTKSSTAQIVDTTVALEDRSLVDEKLLALQPDPEAFRKSEDVAHIEGFGQKVARMVIYGSTDDDPDTFNGLDIRHRLFDVNDPSKQGYTTANMGGSGSVSSAYFVEWGDRTCAGIFPRNGQAGLQHIDRGLQRVTDKNGNAYDAYESKFKWDVGLTVRDYRAIGALRNLKPETLLSGTAAEKLTFIKNFVTIKDRLRNPDRAILYCGSDLYSAFKVFLMDKNNSFVTRDTLENGIQVLRFDGTKIVKLDCISNSETAIS